MDPQATYRLMMDDTNDLDTRAVAATDLLVWLASGGLPGPDAQVVVEPVSGEVVVEYPVLDDCRHNIFKALDALNNATEGTPA